MSFAVVVRWKCKDEGTEIALSAAPLSSWKQLLVSSTRWLMLNRRSSWNIQDNIDDDLTKLLWKHFPKETREKKIHLETLAGREQFGIYYKHPSEQKCVVQWYSYVASGIIGPEVLRLSVFDTHYTHQRSLIKAWFTLVVDSSQSSLTGF